MKEMADEIAKMKREQEEMMQYHLKQEMQFWDDAQPSQSLSKANYEGQTVKPSSKSRRQAHDAYYEGQTVQPPKSSKSKVP